MNVIHVCDRFTPRVYKMVIAQQRLGHDVKLLYLADCAEQVFPTVYDCSRYLSTAQLKPKLAKAAKTADIVWVHTSINSVPLINTVIVLGIGGPLLIWDIHDFVVDEITTINLSNVDLVVTPSEMMADQVRNVRPGTDVAVIYNKCPKQFQSRAPERPEIDGCVLESGIDGPSGLVYRDYTHVQDMLGDFDCNLFIYCMCEDILLMLKYYKNLMQPMPIFMLIPSMGRFKFGWAGASNDQHHINSCVTNKFWEYLTAGIPVATWRSSEMSDIAQVLGVEVNVSEGDDFEMGSAFEIKEARRRVRELQESGVLWLENDPALLAILGSSGRWV